MRIRDTEREWPVRALRREEATGADTAAPGTRCVENLAAVAGIPATELTPQVCSTLARFMRDVHGLREDLERAQTRIHQLEQLADQDPLVPLINRRAFVRELSRVMALVERYGGRGAVLYFDVNGMKRINDRLGHTAGDAALRHVAETLAANVRTSDVVGRLGGDEFGVLLLHADCEAALAKAEDLAAAVRAKPLPIDGLRLPLGVAYGVHSFAGGEQADAALAAADRAMYDRKREAQRSPLRSGRSGVAGGRPHFTGGEG